MCLCFILRYILFFTCLTILEPLHHFKLLKQRGQNEENNNTCVYIPLMHCTISNIHIHIMYILDLLVYDTVGPPNKGHVGTRRFVLYREVSFIRRLKCTGIIGIGTSRFVLYREVSFIQKLKCTGLIGIGTSRFVLYREVSFIRSVLYRRFHCISNPHIHMYMIYTPDLLVYDVIYYTCSCFDHCVVYFSMQGLPRTVRKLRRLWSGNYWNSKQRKRRG